MAVLEVFWSQLGINQNSARYIKYRMLTVQVVTLVSTIDISDLLITAVEQLT